MDAVIKSITEGPLPASAVLGLLIFCGIVAVFHLFQVLTGGAKKVEPAGTRMVVKDGVSVRRTARSPKKQAAAGSPPVKSPGKKKAAARTAKSPVRSPAKKAKEPASAAKRAVSPRKNVKSPARK
ncbi:unnamed protein product [Pedinophyceae sp. YPF-701]|nr:unnamed protein product [Pedinophyceae sp. YPF-701]